MILIQTQEFDSSTDKVIDWIDYNGFNFIRINENTELNLSFISQDFCNDSFFILEKERKEINSNEIKAYWYRRGYLNNKQQYIIDCEIKNYKRTVNKYLIRENEYFKEFFYFILESKNHIGSISDNKINKLKVLSHAKEIGLLIPNTIITNKKEDLLNFLSEHNQVITKSIKDNLHLDTENGEYFMQYTNLITKKHLKEFPKYFFPSIFQELINKQFELRIFYLKNKFYAMAIFSQENDKTKIDFRQYDKTKPNRSVPFNLPLGYQEKLQILMDMLNLTSGSIDVLVSEDGTFYFLEVNPVGQFGQVSRPCNYFIEKEIANQLCKK
jgi:ATP-GRASP peptide maturase of grasp-with-spasm system